MAGYREAINRDAIENADLRKTIINFDTMVLALSQALKPIVDKYEAGMYPNVLPIMQFTDQLNEISTDLVVLMNSFNRVKNQKVQSNIYTLKKGITNYLKKDCVEEKSENLANAEIVKKIQENLDKIEDNTINVLFARPEIKVITLVKEYSTIAGTRAMINRDTINNANLKSTICQFDTAVLALASRALNLLQNRPKGDSANSVLKQKDRQLILDYQVISLDLFKVVNSFDETKFKAVQAKITEFSKQNTDGVDHTTEKLPNDTIVRKIENILRDIIPLL